MLVAVLTALVAPPAGADASITAPPMLPCGPAAVPPSPAPCMPADPDSPTMQPAAPPCVATSVTRCPSWMDLYDHPGGHGTTGIDMAFDVKTSPDGQTVYVTGQSWQDAKNHYDFATLAYDPATGARRWLARYDGPGDEHDIPQSMALSADGTRLYVTGWVHMNPVGEGADYATVAYDTATGEQLWDATYEGPDQGDDSAYGVAVSPDGERVYVTGKSGIGYENMDFATVAYRADTGEQEWVARHSHTPGGTEDVGISVAVAPDGETVYMNGAAGTTWTTIAYRASDGEPSWVAADQKGYAYWLALSPDGSKVYSTGSKHQADRGLLLPNWDYATVAYDAATGVRLWEGTWASENVGLDVPYGHAVSPDGSRIYLTGSATGAGVELNMDMVTAAFDTSDGHLLWTDRSHVPGFMFEGGGGVAAGANRVFVTGWSSAGFGTGGNLITVSYDPAGTRVWTAVFNGLRTHNEQDFGDSIVLAPNGGRAFITGRASYQSDPDDPANTQPGVNSTDFLTLAYDA